MNFDASTFIVTAPNAWGVTLAVYVVPDPEKRLNEPFPSVTLLPEKSVDDPLKVNFILI